nr:hypothetical protein [uncultured Psychrobacter sp.]
MSQNNNPKKVVGSRLGTKSQDDISPKEAMIYALATNIMAIALADIPDAKERVASARHKLMNKQPNVTLSMRRHLDDVESFTLDAIRHAKPTINKYH